MSRRHLRRLILFQMLSRAAWNNLSSGQLPAMKFQVFTVPEA